MTALVIRQVKKSFGAARVLQNIDCVVNQGEVVSLLGQSGCGKTTLLRLIAGFDCPDSGSISLAGRVVADRYICMPAEKRHIGYVPQEGALFPHLNVYDNIAFGLHKSAQRDKIVNDMLELAGIGELRACLPQQLSGGQQQRVALARALAPSPRILLLDEPFNALDANLRSSICQDVMTLLRHVGATVVLVTHDQHEAFVSSDRVAVMREGRIVQIDHPVRLYQQPIDLRTASMVGDTVLLNGHVVAGGIQTRLGVIPSTNLAHSGCRTVCLMLRPEQLHLVSPEHAVRARIVQIGFHGHYSNIHAILEPPETLDVTFNANSVLGPSPCAEPTELLLRSHGPSKYQVGDLVGIHVSGAGMSYATAI